MTRKARPAAPTAVERIIADHARHSAESVLYWERRAERIRNVNAAIARDRITIGRRSRTIEDWSTAE